MKYVIPKLRPVVKIHGGKFYSCRKILKFVPDNVTFFVVPFGGAGSVLLNSQPGPLNIYYDSDREIVELMWAVRFNLNRFLQELRSIKYTQDVFEYWKEMSLPQSPFFGALRTYIVHRMSRGGLGKSFAWSDRMRGGRPGDLNAWLTMLDHLPMISARLCKVELIGQKDFRESISECDRPHCIFYCDPPYLHETRSEGSHKAYRNEMTPEDHEDFLKLVTASVGRFLISGYDSELYRQYLSGWRRVEFTMPNHSGQGQVKERRTEVLWMNFDEGGVQL